jgi:hypothetical protein
LATDELTKLTGQAEDSVREEVSNNLVSKRNNSLIKIKTNDGWTKVQKLLVLTR